MSFLAFLILFTYLHSFDSNKLYAYATKSKIFSLLSFELYRLHKSKFLRDQITIDTPMLRLLSTIGTTYMIDI